MAKRRGSSSTTKKTKQNNAAGAGVKRPSPIEQIKMLRNFCPTGFSEHDLSTCLSQAGYNVELAAERLLSGQFQPSKKAASSSSDGGNVVPISSVKKFKSSTTTTPSPAGTSRRPSTGTNRTPSSSASSSSSSSSSSSTPSTSTAVGKKRPSPDSNNTKTTSSSSSSTSSSSRPEKKRSSPPHVIPPTPAVSAETLSSSSSSSDHHHRSLLLCERWIIGTCTTRRGRVSHKEALRMSHYQNGNNMNVRFRGDLNNIEGNLPRSLGFLLTPLMRVTTNQLIDLRAEALMDERDIPIGGEIPLQLTVSIASPEAFFAIFDEKMDKSESKSASSMFFHNNKRGNKKQQQQQRNFSSKLSLPEVAFKFLQWAHYGDLPEIPDFSSCSKEEEESNDNDDDDNDDEMMMDEDADTEKNTEEERPEWAKSVTESDNLKSTTLPEMDDPRGFDKSVALRPYQKQALYWMMKREQQGESRDELKKELKLLSELANAANSSSFPSSSSSTLKEGSTTNIDVYCDRGPIVVSEEGQKKAKTLDGQSPQLNHPLWKTRYLGSQNLGAATSFFVNELLGIATCHPPSPPKQCQGGILADDMGLGKTVMLLALILKFKEKETYEDVPATTLVVAPLSLISQWEEEIETKTGLSYRVWYGVNKEKTSEEDFDVDIVLTSYGTLQAELQKKLKKENSNASHKGLLGRNWLRVILDEAHCIKNQATLSSKACCSLIATYRWVVTGTVIHNSLDDVFSLVKFLNHQPWCEPGFWKAAISNEMNRVENAEIKEDGTAEPTGMMVALGRVRRLLAPLMLRRTKESLAADGKPILSLPPVEHRLVNVQLTNPEREFYNALLAKSQSVFDGFIKAGTASKSWLQIFSLLHRLRMACDHIALTVKSHIDEADWNSAAASKDGSEADASAVSLQEVNRQASTAVDDAFINGLLKKFRQSARAAEGNHANVYSDQVAHALNEMIKDSATHIAEECPVCLEFPLIHESCVTACAHIFCRNCLLGYLKEKAATEKKFRVPDGDCPVCHADVKSSEIITLAKGEDGGYTSNFLNETKKPPTPVKVKRPKNNDAARQVLENAVNGASSSKLVAVMTELHKVWQEAPGTKVLIFSQYLGFLDLLETSLGQEDIPYGRLDGKMTLKQRVAALDLFKEDSQARIITDDDSSTRKQRQGSVMLVSMKAGGVGLNLVAASTVFIVDPWWNQSIEDQCINRVHRIGQKAAKVRVRKFVVEDSVEERIVELQNKKKNVASEVYSDIDADGTMSDSRPTIDDFKLIFGNLK